MFVYLRLMINNVKCLMSFVPRLKNLGVVLNRLVAQKSVLHKVVLSISPDLLSL